MLTNPLRLMDGVTSRTMPMSLRYVKLVVLPIDPDVVSLSGIGTSSATVIVAV
jgi:hypothetical protein